MKTFIFTRTFCDVLVGMASLEISVSFPRAVITLTTSPAELRGKLLRTFDSDSGISKFCPKFITKYSIVLYPMIGLESVSAATKNGT